MGVHNRDYGQQEPTDFYVFGPRYWREFYALTAQQQRVAHSHVLLVGAQLIGLMIAEFDHRRIGSSRPRYRGTLLELLARGQIDEAVLIGERTSLELIRRLGLVVVDGVTWHTLH